jgi:hypothetical protein
MFYPVNVDIVKLIIIPAEIGIVLYVRDPLGQNGWRIA